VAWEYSNQHTMHEHENMRLRKGFVEEQGFGIKVFLSSVRLDANAGSCKGMIVVHSMEYRALQWAEWFVAKNSSKSKALVALIVYQQI
jgi:hypothetical protein